MQTFVRAISAEILKLKRSLALRLALLAPLVIVGANVGMYLQSGVIGVPEGVTGDVTPWLWYGQQNVVIWGLLMVPLFVTLEAALAGSMEHSNETWKHLNALPVPRGILYATKQFSGMALIAVSSIMLVLFIVGGGLLLRLTRPNVGLGLAIPWRRLWTYAGLTFVGAWLVISIQVWISMRWKSFVVACAAGVALTIAGVFIIHADWGSFWPWAISGAVGNEFSEGVVLWRELLVGGGGGLLAALLGSLDVTRQDVL